MKGRVKAMPDFNERIQRAANKTWDAIGDDVLRAKAQEQPSTYKYGVTVTRDEVVECVIDFLDTYGEMSKDDQELWRPMSTAAKLQLLRDAFPSEEYGW